MTAESKPRWAETDDPVELGLRCVSVATSALMSADNDDNDRFHDGMFALRAIGDLFLALRSLRESAADRKEDY